jgi:hypothetical protein
MPENQYVIIFRRSDVVIIHIYNKGYLQYNTIKEGIINSKRPHQGIDKQIPMGYKTLVYGRVMKLPILVGLYHHYMRRAAWKTASISGVIVFVSIIGFF